jgi:hypothetical protein
MRMISFLGAIPFALLSWTALAQQAPDTGSPGYLGAYGPAGPAKPYSTGPLPQSDAGPGLDVLGPDDSTKTVKAIPCSSFARETDGSTTCVGIPDQSTRAKKD